MFEDRTIDSLKLSIEFPNVVLLLIRTKGIEAAKESSEAMVSERGVVFVGSRVGRRGVKRRRMKDVTTTMPTTGVVTTMPDFTCNRYPNNYMLGIG